MSLNTSRLIRNVGRVPELLRAVLATPQWFDLTTGYLRLKQPYPLVLRFRNRQRITLINRSDLATLWLVFFPPTYPVYVSDQRILDLGANIGAFSLFAANRAPQAHIVAVEPFPETFRKFVAMLEENQLTHRVTAISAALTGSDREVHINDSPGMDSQFRNVSNRGLSVTGISLSSLYERAGWDSADLLKIDIEGSEYDGLLAASPEVLRRAGRIAMEFHPDPRKQKLFDHLREAGFRLQSERDDGAGYGMAHFTRV